MKEPVRRTTSRADDVMLVVGGLLALAGACFGMWLLGVWPL